MRSVAYIECPRFRIVRSEVDILSQVTRISEIAELVEREKKMDLLRWNWMEDAIFFNYFTVKRIFAFLLKLEMIGRWIFYG